MTFFGLGGFEVLLIGAIALFVLGPKRLLDGIRGGRKTYTDLKRQRDVLQSLITEAIDLEDLKKQIDTDGLKASVESLKDDIELDQGAEDVRRANVVVDKSIPRNWNLTPPSIKVDSEVRDAIPDLNIGGDDSGAPEKSDPTEQAGSEMTSGDADNDAGEVKS
ncbi:MAG: hypothetical protein QF590_06940 [Dehalococcoidia bacterium]|jgi:Sec-independent protein translocase protein TatA|nr:hypothetical protein [Chloroflexota bacterium]MDP6055909.1 hypothetical protein [Dehalococcoidia bacterium]MDP7091017.1 hypothetical protein [Dehalococcoidia bacterium]MDP7261415.1 hypothetical protein [Dehalococcoidia bacterium]MDP7485833.1 hypothetical protein [Dehalococcoidia bacterium]|tara:strand:- start:4736 stop:5224 length:489 start_codon:yes stop_codon:yes gene_type:complete